MKKNYNRRITQDEVEDDILAKYGPQPHKSLQLYYISNAGDVCAQRRK